MELFVKTCGGVLLSVILVLSLGNRTKELAMALSIVLCCMVGIAAMEYLRPVIEFADQLEQLHGLDSSLVRILLKATGIGIITEIATLVCTDCGYASVGKVVKILGSAVILWLSLPLYATLVELLQRIMGGL